MNAADVPSIISLLIQIPVVGVFIWYSLQMSKQNQEMQTRFLTALDKRDEMYEKRNTAIIAEITDLNRSICGKLDGVSGELNEHDKFVRDNIQRTGSTTRN